MDDKNQQGVQPTPPVVGGQADAAMPTAPLGGVQPEADTQPETPTVVTPIPAPVTPTEGVTPADGEVSASQVADRVMDKKADFGQPTAKPAEDTTPQVPIEPASAE